MTNSKRRTLNVSTSGCITSCHNKPHSYLTAAHHSDAHATHVPIDWHYAEAHSANWARKKARHAASGHFRRTGRGWQRINARSGVQCIFSLSYAAVGAKLAGATGARSLTHNDAVQAGARNRQRCRAGSRVRLPGRRRDPPRGGVGARKDKPSRGGWTGSAQAVRVDVQRRGRCALSVGGTMRLIEYRIPFPATVEEYRVGMQYMIVRAGKEEARRAGNSGIVSVVRHEKIFDERNGLGACIYTEKVFNVRRLLPRFLRAFVSEENAKVVEKSWAAYPRRCVTLYEAPFLSDKPLVSVESTYVPDGRPRENALGLSDEELAKRNVIVLDIASEEAMRMAKDSDIRGFRSDRAGRGELVPGVWMRQADPVMCCYKVCRLDMPQPRIEAWGQRFMQSSFMRYNRQAFLYMDSWIGLRLADIPGALPDGSALPGVKAVVATELSADKTELSVGCHVAELFERADLTNPFFA